MLAQIKLDILLVHVWIKKLFFELKYLENVNNEFDLNYLINLLYYKYSNMYAKALLNN